VVAHDGVVPVEAVLTKCFLVDVVWGPEGFLVGVVWRPEGLLVLVCAALLVELVVEVNWSSEFEASFEAE